MNAYYDMVDGYCYELTIPSRDWRRATDDDWDMDVYTPTGRERLKGFCEIDGVPCAVFKCRDLRLRAQMLVACTRAA